MDAGVEIDKDFEVNSKLLREMPSFLVSSKRLKTVQLLEYLVLGIEDFSY